MEATSPASWLITAGARKRLRPIGLRQQGAGPVSGSTIRDGGSALVEFASPRWSQGSGLTVGVMWLWQDFDHLAFDFAEGVRPTGDFRNEAQFAPVAAALAHEAEYQIGVLRTRFAAPGHATEELLRRSPRRGHIWENFNAGVAAALDGQTEQARRRLRAVREEDPIAPWVREAQETARHVHDLAEDPMAIRTWAQAAIASCRTNLSLTEPATPMSI